MIFQNLQTLEKGKRKMHVPKGSTQSFCKHVLGTPFKIPWAELAKKQGKLACQDEAVDRDYNSCKILVTLQI